MDDLNIIWCYDEVYCQQDGRIKTDINFFLGGGDNKLSNWTLLLVCAPRKL